MWTVALRTLIADRGKLATAMVGVVFSIVLVNLQGGLFLGLIGKASLLVDFGRADIWVGHKFIHNVDFPRDIPVRWIDRIRCAPGVLAADPYVIGHSEMTMPSGAFEDVAIIGCDAGSLAGNAWNVRVGDPLAVRRPDGIIVDELEAAKLEYPRLGDVREIGGRRARIVAKSRGIVGFLVTPYVFTTLDRAAAFLNKPADRCSYFLVKIAPGADCRSVRTLLQSRLPQADVLTREEYAQRSIRYWLTRTGLGISFGAATSLGLLVGAAIVAQTLYAAVLDRLGEFAALKAMGASDQQICAILLSQASTMAFAGAVIGLSAVLFLQSAFSNAHAPIVIPIWLSAASCTSVMLICLVSSLVPYWRVRGIDPVLVFKG